MTCPSCCSHIFNSSVYYVDRQPRIVCSGCGCNVSGLIDQMEAAQLLTDTESGTNAQRFDPVALDRRMVNGEYQYSYPGSNTDPVSPGYERITLNSLREIDRHTKSESAKEQELRSLNLSAERDQWDKRTRERREATKDLIRQKGWSGRYFDLACKKVDAAREKKYTELQRRQVSFHNQAFSFDASNRQGYRDDTVGRRGR